MDDNRFDWEEPSDEKEKSDGAESYDNPAVEVPSNEDLPLYTDERIEGGGLSDEIINPTGDTADIDDIIKKYTEELPSEDDDKTQVMDSLRDGALEITPRDRFSELNGTDDIERTRYMDSVSDVQPSEPENPVRRRKKRKKKSKINHTKTMGQVFLGVIISVVALGFGVYLSMQVITALQDFTGMAKRARSAEVEITDNMNISEIAEVLYENNIIKMPSLFETYIKFADEDSGILSGKYTVSANMSYGDLIDLFKTVKTYTETVSVMIPEGMTAHQIGLLLEENLVCSAKDFEEYYSSKLNEYDFEEEIAENENRYLALEGYLYPDTYEFYVIDDLRENPDFDTSSYAKIAAEKMYDNFESKITKSITDRAEELGMSLDEVLTLASLIQKEGTNADNMGVISSVFHNRLADPERFPSLQSDTTDTYLENVIRPNVTDSERYAQLEAAYDTYACEGLPAGPICSPGMEAIEAALYPEETDYYYFLASKGGAFYYAQTYEQHEQNIIDAALRDETQES